MDSNNLRPGAGPFLLLKKSLISSNKVYKNLLDLCINKRPP